jgi:hypothetical protein
LEFKSETLELKPNKIQGQGLHSAGGAGFGLYDRSARRVISTWDAGGGIVMDLQARRLNLLLKAMTGSFGSTNATLTQNGSTGEYKAIHVPGPMNGNSLTMQKGVPSISGVVEPFSYTGCKFSDWTITAETGSLAQLELTVDARNELGGVEESPVDPLNASVPALGTWTDVTQDVFYFREATVITGTPSTSAGVTSLGSTTTLANVKSCSVKQALSLDSSRYFLGGSGFKSEQLENGFRSITGSMVVEWQSAMTYYEAFEADTPLALQLTFKAFANIGSSTQPEELDVLIPVIKLDGESPKVAGPQVVTESVTFTGLDDETNNPIQLTYFTSDTAD